MTFVRRTTIAKRAGSAFDKGTLAFVCDDLDSPDYPSGMSLFIAKFTLEAEAIHVLPRYNARLACEAYGIDPIELLERIEARRRRRAPAEPEEWDEFGHTIKRER